MSAVISAVAHFVPPTVVGNPELSARLGVSEDWIVERTGIRERRVADGGGTSDLIVPAAEECLRRAGVSAADVDCVLVATITPDHLTPATAVTVIRRLGASRAWGFDLSAACSGFLYGLVVAAQLVETGAARRVLLAGADRMSCITDPDDRRTAVLLGDGAGVALVEPGDDPAAGLQDFLLVRAWPWRCSSATPRAGPPASPRACWCPIEFVSLTDPSVAVSGEIRDDGTFALHTLKNTDRADGAAEGSYRVTVLPRIPADQKPVRPLTLAATYKVEPKENVFRIEIDPGRPG
jgi:hypothetical protein